MSKNPNFSHVPGGRLLQFISELNVRAFFGRVHHGKRPPGSNMANLKKGVIEAPTTTRTEPCYCKYVLDPRNKLLVLKSRLGDQAPVESQDALIIELVFEREPGMRRADFEIAIISVEHQSAANGFLEKIVCVQETNGDTMVSRGLDTPFASRARKLWQRAWPHEREAPNECI